MMKSCYFENNVFDIIRSNMYIMKHRLLKPSAYKHYQKWLSCEKMSAEELSDYNFQRRLDLIRYAYDKTDFYHKRFSDIGLHPLDVKTQEDWEKIPVLTKDDIRTYFENIRVNDIPREFVKSVSTGGSTGEPLRVLSDTRFPAYLFAWMVARWWNVPIGSNYAFLGRLLVNPDSLRLRVKNCLLLPTHKLLLDASHVSTADLDLFLHSIIKYKPAKIAGYIGTIAHFANFCLEKGVSFDFIKAVSTTSAPLTPSLRKLIETAFSAPVYDQYGCSEVHWLATECREQNNLHVHSNIRYLELLDVSGKVVPQGKIGSVTVTDLENRVFPLIRYQVGDLAMSVKGLCSCGLPFPLIAPVKGRTTDQILMPDGTVISGEYLTTIFDDYPQAVKSFHVHQHDDYSIDLSVVVNEQYPNSREEIALVYQNLVKMCAPVNIKIIFTDQILEDGGKVRYIRSDIKKAN